MQLVVGTRGSKLSLVQTNFVLEMLRKVEPSLTFAEKIIKTKGDLIKETPLPEIGVKGIFVKEIDKALLKNEIDFAVHSMKDVPTKMPEDLEIVAVPKRDSPYEVLVSKNGKTFNELPDRAKIGTSSLRRRAECLALRKDLIIEPMRGNVDTRVRKVINGLYDATIAAEIGLERLGLKKYIVERLPLEHFIPTPGQGALAIVTKKGRVDVIETLKKVNHEESKAEIMAERALLSEIGGGCHVPMGVLARVKNNQLIVTGTVFSFDGGQKLEAKVIGKISQAEKLGREAAIRLKEAGADKLLGRE
mgnify:CR=1 FL=1